VSIVSNTLTTYGPGGTGGIVGTREDLSDVIYNISPKDTPFVSAAGRTTADNTLFEWQTDSLATAAANEQLEGDEATYAQASSTTRIANRTQISRKTAIISGTAEATVKAGRKSEAAYQIAKRGVELRLDIEKTVVGTNQIQRAGDETTARRTTSMLNYFSATNSTIGTGSAAHPVASGTLVGTARVDGTTRAISLALVQEVVQLGYAAGAKVDGMTFMVGPTQKQKVSALAGSSVSAAQQAAGRGPVAVVATVDVFVTDFGTLKVVPNRHMRSREALILDFEFIELAYLRPFASSKLSKTGDAEKWMVLAEWGLKVKNSLANLAIFDLT
jgi:hypothetical protein